MPSGFGDFVGGVVGELGECPVWCPQEQVLYWIDIPAGNLHRFDPASGQTLTRNVPHEIGSFALREGGGFVMALENGFHFFDWDGGLGEFLGDPEADTPEHRFNDGRTDPDGRFWAGTMRRDQDPSFRASALYRLGTDHAVTRQMGGFIVYNGMAFSPDGNTVYFSDSNRAVRTIWKAPFDRTDGVIGARTVLADTHGLPGRPDGAAVDAEGCYWIALNEGWCLGRFTPDGRLDRLVAVPVEKPSMCAFGGPRLDELYVTSIRPDNRPEEELQRWHSRAGGLFVLSPGVQGLPEPRYRG